VRSDLSAPFVFLHSELQVQHALCIKSKVLTGAGKTEGALNPISHQFRNGTSAIPSIPMKLELLVVVGLTLDSLEFIGEGGKENRNTNQPPIQILIN